MMSFCLSSIIASMKSRSSEIDFVWFVDHDDTIDSDICDECGSKLYNTFITMEEYFYIKSISEDRDFIDAMIEHKQKDIIEFKTKIAQFKAQVDAQEERKRQERNLPRCPKCGSTSITASQRGYSFWTGFLGSNKTVNRCSNCGHTWKP